jgi:YD repeat-containing protein
MPNGLVATYGQAFGTYGRYLTELRDPFNNVVTFQWEAGTDHLQMISQWLNGSARYVTFTAWAGEIAAGMDYDNRSWSYVWSSPGDYPGTNLQLLRASVPDSTQWNFTYGVDAQGAPKMATLTTPNGAGIAYTWAENTFPTTPTQRVAIKQRNVIGPNLAAAEWDFDWQSTGRTLILTSPTNWVSYDTVVQNDIPVGSSRVVHDLSGTVLDSETLTYQTIQGALGPIPVLWTATATRDGRTFTTTYSYSSSDYADYAQPNQIVEAGELTRTTSITYRHDFSPYIRGRVASMTAMVGGQSVTSSTTYDSATGFVTSTTASGMTTTYTNDGYGNTGAVTDATNRTTAYGYQWGVVKEIDTAGGSVVRTLNNTLAVSPEHRIPRSTIRSSGLLEPNTITAISDSRTCQSATSS